MKTCDNCAFEMMMSCNECRDCKVTDGEPSNWMSDGTQEEANEESNVEG